MKCERCGEKNPAEIHTCTPNYVDRRQWKYDPMTGNQLSQPETDIVQDAIVCGIGITKDGKRIDPASIYKEPEPVAWMIEFENGEQELHFVEQAVGETQIPLYTAPPQREEGCAECGKKSSDGWALYCVKCSEREWQGLTDEDLWELVQKTPSFDETVAAVEAKLKAKNA
jgi:hypothetical protein